MTPILLCRLCRTLAATTLSTLLLTACSPADTRAADSAAAGAAAIEVPAWLYPLNPPDVATKPFDKLRPLHIPGSKRSHTEAELNDLFQAAEWGQYLHGEVPTSVMNGRKPDVYACGYCHTITGQGRPENASLAGLPAEYIVQQVKAMRSGERRSAWAGPYRPSDRMHQVAAGVSDADLAAAARYFSAQPLSTRVRVEETDSIPRPIVVGWLYAAAPGGEQEPLGQRLMEFAPDPVRHELRDDAMTYVAYVPRGSIERGKEVASRGRPDGTTLPCAGCHGPAMRGIAFIPPLAGRSPTYLLRALYAFRVGARKDAQSVAMQSECSHMSPEDMIAVAAYAASLPP